MFNIGIKYNTKKALASWRSFTGFTLVELLVVIVIIGVLATLATVAISSARTRARDAKRISDLKQISTALELYYADYTAYPSIITPGQALTSADGTKTYMAKVPSNPTPRAEGSCSDLDYQYASGNDNYSLIGCLSKAVGDVPAGSRKIEKGGQARDLGPTDGLVGWWMLDGLNGTKDLSGNGNNGVISGGVTTSTGKFGEAFGGYSFNGSSGKVTIADNDKLDIGTGDFSIVISFKTPASLTTVSSGALIDKGNQGVLNLWYNCRVTGGASNLGYVTCYVGDASGTYWAQVNSGANSLSVNTYYQMVVSANRTTGRRQMFLNTVASSPGTDVPNSVNISNASNLILGYEPNSLYFGGSIYEVRLYNRALVQDDINQLWNATKP